MLFDEQADAYLGDAGRAVPFAPQTNLPDPLVALAFLAAGTHQIRLATGVLILPQRNPVQTAKQAATLDWMSGGRLDLAIGIGWSRLEYVATATPWPDRGGRCDDYVDVMRALWRDGVSEFTGPHYSLPPSYQYPKPVQRPGPPIWFGGSSPSARRRIAARGDGWYAFDTVPKRLAEQVAELADLLSAAGRPRDAVKIVHGAALLIPRDRDDVLAYAAAGAHQIVVSLSATDPTGRDRELDTYAERILG